MAEENGSASDDSAAQGATAQGLRMQVLAQFVRDMDWWKSVNPDKPFSEHELHKLESGMEFAAAISRAASAERCARARTS